MLRARVGSSNAGQTPSFRRSERIVRSEDTSVISLLLIILILMPIGAVTPQPGGCAARGDMSSGTLGILLILFVLLDAL
jgi:hypothetical protein